MFSFIHAADIHLDSPLRGLSRYEGAPVEEIRGATRRALKNLVSLAIESEVDFVLISGDLYDGDWKDHNTGLFFATSMSDLRCADIDVFVIAGNHDAASVITRTLRMPENVRFLSTKHAETIPLETVGAAIHGRGFPTRTVDENLAADYPPGIPDMFNIGMLHTSLTGREGHDAYAPCTVDDLLGRGYDYWALGHVHVRERIDADIPVWFPGNIQGRHIRETGPKGCLLVTVTDTGEADAAFRELDTVRWSEVDVDIADARNETDCLDLFRDETAAVLDDADGRLAALRVRFHGESTAHERLAAGPDTFRSSVRSTAVDLWRDRVWIEKVEIAGSPPSAPLSADMRDGPLGELNRVIDAAERDEAILREFGAALTPLIAKLPPELREGGGSLRLEEPGKLREILKQVRPLLMARLRGAGGGS